MKYDTIVIGAGQAGLTMGYFLRQSKQTFKILDQAKEIGHTWKNRYNSLRLFTPSPYSSLPGLELEGSLTNYPTKNDIAAYLKSYALKFSLPVQLNTIVNKLTRVDDGFNIITNQGEFVATNVVVASGPFQKPLIPTFSTSLSTKVLQLHSSEYKNSRQLKDGSVLVVGGGNSGAQIAVELSKERKVCLSVSHNMKFLPLNIGKKSVLWYFDRLGIYRVKYNTLIGKILQKQSDPIFGLELKSLIKNGVVQLKPRATSAKDESIFFKDRSELHVNNIIWSTGYQSDYGWIKIPNIFDKKGIPEHKRGVSPVKGLYYLGLPWQYNRSSALLQGVGKDAEYLYRQIGGS